MVTGTRILGLYLSISFCNAIGSVCGGLLYISLSGTRPYVNANFKINSRHISRWVRPCVHVKIA